MLSEDLDFFKLKVLKAKIVVFIDKKSDTPRGDAVTDTNKTLTMKKNISGLKLMFLLGLALYSGSVRAQVHQKPELNLPSALPPSPNASDLGRVGDIPVSLSTGSMNYNIPLVNLKCGALNLGLSLDYGSGGVKVDQIASRAGLGWTLNAGWVITVPYTGKKTNLLVGQHHPGMNQHQNPRRVPLRIKATVN